MVYDPEAYHAFMDIVGVVKLPQEVFSRSDLRGGAFVAG
jgi:hypothetical protein